MSQTPSSLTTESESLSTSGETNVSKNNGLGQLRLVLRDVTLQDIVSVASEIMFSEAMRKLALGWVPHVATFGSLYVVLYGVGRRLRIHKKHGLYDSLTLSKRMCAVAWSASYYKNEYHRRTREIDSDPELKAIRFLGRIAWARRYSTPLSRRIAGVDEDISHANIVNEIRLLVSRIVAIIESRKIYAAMLQPDFESNRLSERDYYLCCNYLSSTVTDLCTIGPGILTTIGALTGILSVYFSHCVARFFARTAFSTVLGLGAGMIVTSYHRTLLCTQIKGRKNTVTSMAKVCLR